MSPETSEHLNKVELVIKKGKEILARNRFQRELRTLVVAASITQMIEHHEAMLLLIRNAKVGSAFALAHSIVDSMYRGMWMNFCATAAQLEKFEKDDKFPLNMTDIAAVIDEAYRGEGFFENLRKRSWPALCSYSHTGMLQLGRRFTGDKLEPSYTDGEIVEATTTVTTCILMLVGKFLAVQKCVNERAEVEALVGTYHTAPAAKK
jgi:hypothetical protein